MIKMYLILQIESYRWYPNGKEYKQIAIKAAYVVIGVNLDGKKEVLWYRKFK